MSQPYNNKFYAEYAEGMLRSADQLLSLLWPFIQPKVVADFGCGQGAWLAAAEELGAEKCVGYDGFWVDQKCLFGQEVLFRECNLAKEMPSSDEHFDFVWSLEVAEHLPPEQADNFIKHLCSVSDIILFGAAIPGQGGTDHIHEVWQTEWVQRFQEQNYQCIDIRAAIWDNKHIEWWYRQNAFVFIKRGHSLLDNKEFMNLQGMPHNLVHPDHLNDKIQMYMDGIKKPTLRFCLGTCKLWLKNKIFGSK